ncbi:MAG TPA: DNA starvation/stationary phase protection protein, partial [Actinomycetota bacterium]|nr:DNA starvation/stationary phase protection protein [Actinomycetota bacterium]
MATLERTSTKIDVGAELQGTLAELIDLSLQGKQAHWNLTGTTFLALHRHLDDMIEEHRGWSDVVAERAVTIGAWPDGRAATVAARSALEDLPTGPIADRDVVRLLGERIDQVVDRIRWRVDAVGSADPG